MAQPPSPSAANARSDALGILFGALVLLLAAVAWVLWLLYGTQIRYYTLAWKWLESWPFDWLPFVSRWRDAMAAATARPADLGLVQWLQLMWAPSLLWAWLPLLLGVQAYRRGRRHPASRARRVHGMRSLMEAQVRNFSAIAPIIDRDGTRDTSEQARPADRPEEWAQRHGLLRPIGQRLPDGRVAREFDAERARRVLVEDLGELHSDLRRWRPHELAMFAVLAEAALEPDGGMDRSRALRDALNYSARNRRSRPNYALATELFNKWWPQRGTHEALRVLCARHRYIRSLLFALLMELSEKHTLPDLNRGVLAPAEFIWLRFQDRALWYPLNNCGSRTPVIEAAAVFNQYQAELAAHQQGHVLTEPHVEEALSAWREYLVEAQLISTEGLFDAVA